MKVFVKLQTPSIELKVSAEDAGNNKDSIVVGFKRYTLKDTEVKFKELLALLEATTSENIEPLDTYIKDEVLYIKQVKLDSLDANGKAKELSINDTREAKPIEDLWGTPEECLAVLLDMYLESAPYRSSLITALQKAFINTDFKDAEVKN